MKLTGFMDEEKLVTTAVDVLIERLGAVEASRFLSLPKKKRVESVKRHRMWQSKLEKNEFFKKVFGR